MIDALPDGAPHADVLSESKVSCHQGNYSCFSTLIHFLACGYIQLGAITDLLNVEVPHEAREWLCFVPVCVCISRSVNCRGAAQVNSSCVSAAWAAGNF